MDKTYKIEFCWLTSLPTTIVFDGKEKQLTTLSTIVKGKNVPNILDRLQGTDTKLISCINKIREC